MYTPPQPAFSPHISRSYTAQQNSQPVNSEWPVSHRALAARAGLPLHPRVEHPQDEVKDAVIAQFALWTTLGHREVRQDNPTAPLVSKLMQFHCPRAYITLPLYIAC